MSKLRKKFEEEHEEHIDESWLIPYADILTLLLALFIVLFAASSVDKQKFISIAQSLKSELTGTKIAGHKSGLSVQPPTTQLPDSKVTDPEFVIGASPGPSTEETELKELKGQLEKYIGNYHLQAVTTLTETKRGVEITFKDVILFDPGKADLKESSFTTLDALVQIIKILPNPISIEGHTDNVPIGNAAFSSNWELSGARAASVLHYFESKQIASSRLQYTGYGEFQPLYPNDTKEHRQANRRVNIVILRNS
jgi:chemotaxis protein MotB